MDNVYKLGGIIYPRIWQKCTNDVFGTKFPSPTNIFRDVDIIYQDTTTAVGWTGSTITEGVKRDLKAKLKNYG